MRIQTTMNTHSIAGIGPVVLYAIPHSGGLNPVVMAVYKTSSLTLHDVCDHDKHLIMCLTLGYYYIHIYTNGHNKNRGCDIIYLDNNITTLI